MLLQALDVSEKSHQERGGAEHRLWRRAERMEMGRLMIPPQQTRCRTEGEGRSRRGGSKKEINE